MKKLLVFFIFIFIGCASSQIRFQDIRDRALEVDPSDGIDKSEAITLAQNHIISKGLADRLLSLTPLKVVNEVTWVIDEKKINYVIPPTGNRFAKKLDKIWKLSFRDREHSILRIYTYKFFIVIVNARDGKIERWGIDVK